MSPPIVFYGYLISLSTQFHNILIVFLGNFELTLRDKESLSVMIRII